MVGAPELEGGVPEVVVVVIEAVLEGVVAAEDEADEPALLAVVGADVEEDVVAATVDVVPDLVEEELSSVITILQVEKLYPSLIPTRTPFDALGSHGSLQIVIDVSSWE